MYLNRGENQKAEVKSFGEMEIYQLKPLIELFLLAKILSHMIVQIFSINNWNQYTNSD